MLEFNSLHIKAQVKKNNNTKMPGLSSLPTHCYSWNYFSNRTSHVFFGTQTAVSSQRTVQPSPWQQHISVPQQLENSHYSQVTLIHSGPGICGPVLTHCSLYYQYQECYNSFPQWRLVLNSLSHLGGQRFSGVMVMSVRETGSWPWQIKTTCQHAKLLIRKIFFRRITVWS